MTALLPAIDPERLRELVRAKIRDVPDFPKPGILFRDISPVLADAEALAAALELHVHRIVDLVGPGPKMVDKVVGIESRGFLFGMALAHRIGAGFVLVRKPGKLPMATVEATYALEYGEDRLQIHEDAIGQGERVVLVDDLLATGGTSAAARDLVRRIGGEVVAALFLVELTALRGRLRLPDLRVETVLAF
jgi:adenine phosphoribosyltransferase